MKRIIGTVFLILFSALFIITDIEAVDWEAFSKISYLDWVEKTSLSKRDPFVREFGPELSVGSSVMFYPTENFFSKSQIEVFGGWINYQGEYIVNRASHDTSGARLGATLEETLGYKIKISGDLNLSPFAALGFSTWWRQVSGETWYTGYGKLGIQVDYGKIFCRAGALIPLYSEAHGRWAGVYWINGGRETSFKVQPKGVPTPFAEIGIRRGRMTASFFYERKKWEESDRVDLGGGVSVFQPETTQDVVGLRVGFSF